MELCSQTNEEIEEETICEINGDVTPKKSSKSIGFKEAFSLTFGQIVGSGIFISVSPTFIVFDNSIGMVVVFWIIGGIVALLGGLCYAEMSTRYPESGGERAYYKKVLSANFSKFFVMVYAFIVRGLVSVALASTATSYLVSIFTDGRINVLGEKSIMLAIMLSCVLINCLSKNIANKASIVFALLKFLALLIIIIGGIYHLIKGNTTEWKKPFATEGFSLYNLTTCFVNIFWSYEGWNTLGLVAGDMKNPSKDLPVAISTGVSTVILTYVLATISYTSILGYQNVRVSEVVAKEISPIILSSMYFFLPLLVALSSIGSIIGLYYTLGCVSTSAGYSGELPKFFSLVHKKQRTPIISILSILLISLCYLPLNFQVILSYCAYITWIFYLCSFICLIKIKFFTEKPADNKTIFRIPSIFIVPLVLVCVFMIVMVFVLKPVGCGIFTVIISIILIFCFFPDKYVPTTAFKNLDEKLCNYFENKFGLQRANFSDVSS